MPKGERNIKGKPEYSNRKTEHIKARNLQGDCNLGHRIGIGLCRGLRHNFQTFQLQDKSIDSGESLAE